MKPSLLSISLFFVLLLAGVCHAQYFPLPGSFTYSLNSTNDVFDVSPDGRVAVALRNDPNTVHPAYLTTFDPITGAQFDTKSFGFGPLGVRLAQVGSSLRAVVLTSQGGPRAVTVFDVAADGKLTQLATTTLTTSNTDSGSNIVLSGKAGVGFALVAGGPGKELVAFSLTDGAVVNRLGISAGSFSQDALEMVETADNKRVLAFLSDLSTLALVDAANPAAMTLMGTSSLPRNNEFSASGFAGIAFSADAHYVFLGNGFTDFAAVDVTTRQVVDTIGGNFRFGRARIFESGQTRLLALQSTTSGTGAGQNTLLLVDAADPADLKIVKQSSGVLSSRADFTFSQAGDRLYVVGESGLSAWAVPGLTKIWEQPVVPSNPFSTPSPKQVKLFNQSKEVIGAWEVSLNNFTSVFGSFPSDPPSVSVADPAAAVAEGAAAGFTISLSAPTTHRVTVDYTTSNETASSPGDFELAGASVVFEPGETQKTVFVQTVNDSTDEFDETFKLNVAKTNVGTIGRSPAFATILDDDAPPVVSIVAGSVTEGDTGTRTGTVEVVLADVSGKPVTVSYATSDGTANAGSDYAAGSGQVTLNPGETRKTVPVTVNGDAAVEADETVIVTISNPVNATLGVTQAALTILNDDPKVQFGSTSVTVTEGTDLFATLNVTRPADLSTTAMSVSYETLPGSASARGDYTPAFGRLRFAPGESSKEIKVLITDDAYGEQQETFTVRLFGAEGGGVGTPAVATVFINSNETADAANPVREASFNAQFFVRQHYADFLGREPDADGLQFWTNQLTNCSNPPPADLMVCRVNVSAAFFQSIEFQNTGYLAYRTYKAAYGDATNFIPGTGTISVPVIRLNEFQPDTRIIGDGVIVGTTNWEQRLEANKQAYMLEFVQRARFQSAFPVSMTAAEFVDKLNQNAGGVLSQTERNGLVAQLSADPGGAAARAGVLRSVAENAALQQNELRRAFVLMEYFGYLRRNPDDFPEPGFNFAGWKFWLDKLNEFNGNFVQAEMVKAFISSDEYVKRFGQ